MLNFPKIPKIALRKFSELSHSLWRSKRAKSTQDSFLLGGSSYGKKLAPPSPAEREARVTRTGSKLKINLENHDIWMFWQALSSDKSEKHIFTCF